MNETFQHILFERLGPVGKIVLNRPERRNAITTAMAEEVNAAFVAAEKDESVRVLVLTGAEDSFCPGLDLREYYWTGFLGAVRVVRLALYIESAIGYGLWTNDPNSIDGLGPVRRRQIAPALTACCGRVDTRPR